MLKCEFNQGHRETRVRKERMTSKVEKERAKLVQEKCQEILTDLLRDDDNKYCVDCDAKGMFFFY